jgi:predicted nucleic acid-binding protein
MTAAVVDTDVISLVFKGDSRAEKHLAAIARHDLLVSFMTEAELERWILQANWGDRLHRRTWHPTLVRNVTRGEMVYRPLKHLVVRL